MSEQSQPLSICCKAPMKVFDLKRREGWGNQLVIYCTECVRIIDGNGNICNTIRDGFIVTMTPNDKTIETFTGSLRQINELGDHHLDLDKLLSVGPILFQDQGCGWYVNLLFTDDIELRVAQQFEFDKMHLINGDRIALFDFQSGRIKYPMIKEFDDFKKSYYAFVEAWKTNKTLGI